MAAWELTKTILKDSANLKAYYRFESGALTTDSSGNSHTLTDISDPAETTGVYGGGVLLDSNDAYSTTDGADLQPTTAMTAGAWVKTTGAGSERWFFQNWANASANYAGFFFAISSANKAYFAVGKNTGAGGFQSAIGTTSINDGNWHHIVGTYDGANVRVYVDGKHEANSSLTGSLGYAATSYPRIGCKNETGTNSAFWDGSLDEVFLLKNQALSSDQIKELYEGRFIGELMPQSNLVGLWHLNGNSTDSSGSNNHGTDTAITYSNANGKFGQGAGFNGTTSKVVMPSSIIPIGAKTMIAWAKVSSVPSEHTVMSNYGFSISQGDYMGIAITSGYLRHYCKFTGGTGAVDTYGTTNLADSKWHMLAISYDGTNARLYVDGSLQATSASYTDAGARGFNMQLGVCPDTGAFNKMTGSIDEVAIFSRALSAAEIRKYYAWASGRYI